MKSHWLDYGSVSIFYVDFSDFALNRSALQEELDAISPIVTNQPANSILGLVDLRKTVLSVAMTLLIQGYAWRLGRHIRKAAVVVDGVNESKKMILSSVARAGGREVILFDNVEEAKEWLAASSQQ
jgi:hypothetical protein